MLMKWVLTSFVAAAAFSLSQSAAGQGSPREVIAVGENVAVSAASAERPLVEPQVVAHPKDP